MTELSLCFSEHQIPFLCHCPIAGYSTLRIGGSAELAVFPKDRRQLIRALEAVSKSGTPYAVVGRGSNLLFPDGEYSGVLIFTGGVSGCIEEGVELTVEAGTPVAVVANRARNRSLTGAEFLGGIPGTVGGAVFMNAGAYGSDMSAITLSSEYWDMRLGRVERLEGAAHEFAHRFSVYLSHPEWILLSARLRLQEGDMAEIDRRMAEFAQKRRSSQPLSEPNAGSIFKHPTGHFAGRLIEECALKGATVGGAQISQKHAGFIVNRGGATAADVIELIRQIKQTVYNTHGVVLECELRMLGADLNRITEIKQKN